MLRRADEIKERVAKALAVAEDDVVVMVGGTGSANPDVPFGRAKNKIAFRVVDMDTHAVALHEHLSPALLKRPVPAGTEVFTLAEHLTENARALALLSKWPAEYADRTAKFPRGAKPAKAIPTNPDAAYPL